jgi:two-component system sensor histidine kinase SenX3
LAVALWSNRKAEDEPSRALSPEVVELLDAIDLTAVVLAPGEVPIYYSPSATTLGIIRNDRIVPENLLALFRSVRRSGQSQEGEIEIQRGIGEGIYQLSVRVSKYGSEGLLLAIFQDNSEASRIDAVRRDFVANISHELKTPIGALSLLSEAIAQASDDPKAVQNFAERIQFEAKRLSELVQEIINLSRLQDADPLLAASTVQIDDVVKQAISNSHVHADRRKIELLRGPVSNATVIGDRNQLIIAIQNLIDNAINYSGDGTTVTINTEVQGEIVEIQVIDQGIGIAESDIDRIFERFYRVDPARSRETGGTGLGLAIVKHIVRIHGGDISVWSSKNIGSTFSIKLPIGQEVASEE